MSYKKRTLVGMHIRGIILVALVGVFCITLFLQEERSHLTISFFDVGQGDAALIETPGEVRVLIDGGPDPSVLRALSKEMGFFDRTIDMVVATHPDTDHVGGLLDVFERYHVRSVVMTKHKGQTETAEAFHKSAYEETPNVLYARRGMAFTLEDNIVLEILFPDRSAAHLSANTASVVTRLTYGETSVLFMGDAPKSIERYLVSRSERGSGTLQSDVLKVGHHGSDTSTSDALLTAVDPDHAVISAGADNSYGHPHKEVLETLRAHETSIQNTARAGSVAFESDGEHLWLK